MSNQAEEIEEVEDQAEEQVEDSEVEQEEVEQTETEETEEEEAGESGEVEISIEGESPTPEDAEEANPSWVITDLRKKYRDLSKENRELKAKQQQAQQPAKAVEVGPEPRLEDAGDQGYDTEIYKRQLIEWHERKRLAEEEQNKQKEAAEADRKAWNAKLESYAKHKSSLKVADYEDAEAQAMESLNTTQQAVILQGAKNPASIVYVLGSNPAKLKELSAITNPVNFAFAVAELESKVTITTKPRKSAPLPESKVSGSGRLPVTGDAKLKQLEEKADRTGDRTELVNYRRALKLKQAA